MDGIWVKSVAVHKFLEEFANEFLPQDQFWNKVLRKDIEE